MHAVMDKVSKEASENDLFCTHHTRMHATVEKKTYIKANCQNHIVGPWIILVPSSRAF